MPKAERLPTGEEKVRAVRAMFDSIAPRYDLLNRVLTFGMDLGWRRETVAALGLAPDSLVLDLACGTGDFCRELQRAGLRAVGFDISAGMLHQARTHAPLVLSDVLALPVPDGVADGVTCGFALRNVADLGQLFDEIGRVVRPGGRIGLLEVAEPRSRLPRQLHRFYFHTIVPLIGGLLSDRRAYRYLPASTAYLPETDELLRMLAARGFSDPTRKLLGLGAAQMILGTRADGGSSARHQERGKGHLNT